MTVTADLAKLLDRKYENMSLAELLKAPVHAMAGITEKDAELLKQAFNIKTIGDLGRNRLFRMAADLADLADNSR
ncbi:MULTISPECIES: hypothetical protein [Planotetraspora]|uniref:Uncharacterized protein n=2 Tax=Planotetraspora TaxID=58120 RepID=A0A8J3XNN8_9ACTN|nr:MULTISPECIES: hypothetical protein [Planotetraspora]GII32711.1 hypothetical protein Pmi06nite_61530 [Planotetraspora mira]GII46506.1 hypothetical protein Psi02_29300 [Planotetraspora silvatica]